MHEKITVIGEDYIFGSRTFGRVLALRKQINVGRERETANHRALRCKMDSITVLEQQFLVSKRYSVKTFKNDTDDTAALATHKLRGAILIHSRFAEKLQRLSTNK